MQERLVIEDVPPHFTTVPTPLIDCSTALGPTKLAAEPLAIDEIESGERISEWWSMWFERGTIRGMEGAQRIEDNIRKKREL